MAAPRGISQPPTSFIGSQCQGIHHAPLNTYNTNTKNEFQKKLHINCTQNQAPPPKECDHTFCVLDARNHYPQIKHHTPPPKMEQQHASHPTQGPGKNGPVVSKPNSVFDDFPQDAFPHPTQSLLSAPDPHPLQVRGHPTNRLKAQLIPRFAGPAQVSWCSLERR